METNYRKQEYIVLGYRILLAYIFYFIARLLFVFYNNQLVKVDGLSTFLEIQKHGLAFDTTAIIYTNGLFILLSIFPLWVNTNKDFQNILKWIYFISNGIAMALNFIDLIYYRFNFGRSSNTLLESIEHEENKWLLLSNFVVSYWHVFLLYFITMFVWYVLYQRIKVKQSAVQSNIKYISVSIVGVLIIATLSIGGIRGDFKKSTRPINLVDANKKVSNLAHADVVLNTPFAVLRTLGKDTFKNPSYFTESELSNYIKPIKQYKSSNPSDKQLNVVVFILESFGREYLGSFHNNTTIEEFVSYTPFLDSLAQHSRIYTNAYSNGFKSIHGMSSIIAGIPSFKVAFTSSPYPNQPIESLVSTLKSKGYQTSFFHGAPNGSMGFQGFANILGYDQYYGKTEYNNDADFDGVWGIWDEPFFQYFSKELSQHKQPFMSTMFSVSSHEPYRVPKEYEGKFSKGKVPIHQCIGYTDMALKKFFETAKNTDWYENTLFVLVADHTNQSAYEEYQQGINRMAVPIMFFQPGGDWVGESDEWTHQLDVFPTILDYLGYELPFRSWGRSLLNTEEKPFTFNYANNQYQWMEGDYIITFDGKQLTGVYHKNDIFLSTPLKEYPESTIDLMLQKTKAFIQDYFSRIVNRQLTSN